MDGELGETNEDICAFVYFFKMTDKKKIELLENPKHIGGFWTC